MYVWRIYSEYTWIIYWIHINWNEYKCWIGVEKQFKTSKEDKLETEDGLKWIYFKKILCPGCGFKPPIFFS